MKQVESIKQDFQNQQNDSRKQGNWQERTPKTNNLLFYGKVPPQANELEEAVLGAIMLENDKLLDVFGIIPSEECFYKHEHIKIYAAIKKVYKEGYPVSLLTVTEHLRKHGELERLGGVYFLTKLTMNVVSTGHVEHHAFIIMEKYIKRETIRIAGELLRMGYDETIDFSEGIDFGVQQLNGLMDGMHRQTTSQLPVVYDDVLMEMEELKVAEEGADITGITTGFKGVDELINGLGDGQITVVAGRPGTGKTAFCLNVAYNAIKTDKCDFVLIFSMEMKKEELTKRLMSRIADISYDHILKPKRQSKEESDLLMKKREEVMDKLIFIDDTASITTLEMRSKLRTLSMKYGKGLVIIDYLQLISSSNGKKSFNRDAEISESSREIKKMAMDYSIPVIELSQLNREVEKRSEGRPKLSDLRESGSIEQDASTVLFLYRYSEEDIKHDPSMANAVEVIVAKNRNGTTGSVHLNWKGSRQRFSNIGEFDFEELNQQSGNFRPMTPQEKTGTSFNTNNNTNPSDDLPF